MRNRLERRLRSVARMMPVAALTDRHPLLAHHPIGASTGFLVDERGDWPRLAERAAALSPFTAELAALSETELPGLAAYLAHDASLPFHYLSVHAPSKDLRMAESKLVDTLARLPAQVDAIVVHPDVIDDPTEYRRLGSRLVLENMDSRKAGGRTADELAPTSPRCPPPASASTSPMRATSTRRCRAPTSCWIATPAGCAICTSARWMPTATTSRCATTTSRHSGRSCDAAATCRGSWKRRWRLERLAVRAGAPRRPQRGRAAAPARRAGADRRRGAAAPRALGERRARRRTSRSSCSAPGAAAS